MALVLADRVRETSTTTGTGSVTLAGAYTGFQTFLAGIGNGNNTYYTISNSITGEWEVGIGTYTSSGNTLSRDTVLSSSNAGSLVVFTAGSKDVFVTQPAERNVYVSGTDIVAANSASLKTSYGGTGLTSYTAGDLPYYAAGTALSKLGIGANGTFLTSSGTAPQWTVATSVAVTSISFGTTGLTPATATQGAVTVAGTLITSNGGTGVTSYTAGDLPYYATGTALSKLGIGTSNQVLTSSGTAPQWSTNLSIGSLTASADSTFSSTGALQISAGTTAQRPTGAVGKIRWNSTLSQYEGYDGANWTLLGGAVVSNDTSTSTNVYPTFAAATSGNISTIYTSNAKLLYKPSTGELQASIPVASNGIFVNSATVAASYSIASGYNGHSVGPMTIASGQSVTVASGQRWVIL